MFLLLAPLGVSEETNNAALVLVLTSLVCKWSPVSFFHWKTGVAVDVVVIPLPQLHPGCSAPVMLCWAFVCLHLENQETNKTFSAETLRKYQYLLHCMADRHIHSSGGL